MTKQQQHRLRCGLEYHGGFILFQYKNHMNSCGSMPRTYVFCGAEPRFWAVVSPGSGGPVFFVVQAVPLAMMCDLPVSLMWPSAKRVRIREDPRLRTMFLRHCGLME